MRRTIKLVFIVLIISLLGEVISCNSRSTDAPGIAQKAPPSAPIQKQNKRINLTIVEKLIHDHINTERLKHGLPTIRWDDALSRIARKHSHDMAARNYFGHTSPDGHGYYYRYQKNGYACGITVNGVLRTGAENIFRVHLNALSTVVDGEPKQEKHVRENIAAAAVQGWISNPQERKNILSLIWQREGIGISIGPDDVIFITLNFC